MANLKRHIIPLLLLSIFFLMGCEQLPASITSYKPQDPKINQTIPFLEKNEVYKLYNGPDCEVNANIFEYNNILILMVNIKNNGDKDLEPKDYSISLTDGRDLKKIKLLSRQDLVVMKAKYSGSTGPLQDQVIEATMTNAMKVANVPTKEKVAQLIDLGIINYFSFRPIYAHESRQGVLCFLPNFTLEYPLGLQITIGDKDLSYYFIPQPKEST